MTNHLFRNLLSVAAITLVGVVLYYGIVFGAPLPDHRWLNGKNDLALHALTFFALSLPVLALMQRLVSVIGLAGPAVAVELAQLWIPRRNPGVENILTSLVGVALGGAVVWGLHQLFGRRLDHHRRHGAKSGTK